MHGTIYMHSPVSKSQEISVFLQQRIREPLALLLQFIAILAMLLFCASAFAQEAQPRFRFNAPSDEMDFSLPPVPDLPTAAPDTSRDSGDAGLYGFDSQQGTSEPGEDAPFIDQFFSTTTIIPPEQQKKEEEPEEVVEIIEEVEKPVKKPRKARYGTAFKRYAKPKHQFKSVELPIEIYHKDYSRENKHLPEAFYETDQQYLVEYAIRKNDITYLRTLFKNNAEIHSTARDGTPYLVIAAQHGNIDALRWLLMYKAAVDEADAYGLTALHYAAYSGNPEMVELLLMYGSDKTLVDNKGQAPVDYATNRSVSNTVINMLVF